ncbi:hypothetical protein AB0I86_34240 [Streptomyces sp. NPDC049950]|uniref:hypothetical protein n=1 Tax=Streptomyces sp. NPDC049950 TaxID=3156659 RepID=UPI0034357D7A
MVIASPYTIEHSAQCPPVDPRSKTRLDCRRCDTIREYGPYWIDAEKPVTCGTCGADDAPTPADPRFTGYAGHHSRPENWRSACFGEYLAHGRATAERSTEPGWMPLAHVRLGDVITTSDNWGKWAEPAMVVDIEEGEASPGHPRIFVRWLSDNPHHSGGVWGMWAAPGTPVLLVEAATAEPPARPCERLLQQRDQQPEPGLLTVLPDRRRRPGGHPGILAVQQHEVHRFPVLVPP